MAEELLEVEGKIEREDSLTIASLNASVASLNSSLDEESEYKTTLEERLEALDDKNDEIILIKSLRMEIMSLLNIK